MGTAAAGESGSSAAAATGEGTCGVCTMGDGAGCCATTGAVAAAGTGPALFPPVDTGVAVCLFSAFALLKQKRQYPKQFSALSAPHPVRQVGAVETQPPMSEQAEREGAADGVSSCEFMRQGPWPRALALPTRTRGAWLDQRQVPCAVLFGCSAADLVSESEQARRSRRGRSTATVVVGGGGCAVGGGGPSAGMCARRPGWWSDVCWSPVLAAGGHASPG